MEEGKLPRLRALAERGDFRRLASTNPPQSPVAWTTFATGTGPGRHGIFDFIERDPATYLPDVGTGGVRPPRYWHGVVETAPAGGWTRRRGVPFWEIAAAHGVHAVVLRVPYAFPPDPVPGGRMLSGLGVPDLLGTNSTFFYLADDLAADAKDPGGGRLVALRHAGDEARADVPGPADPRGGGRPALTIPLRLRVDRAADAVTIEFAGRETRVARGGWSAWLAFRVPVAPTTRATTRCWRRASAMRCCASTSAWTRSWARCSRGSVPRPRCSSSRTTAFTATARASM